MKKGKKVLLLILGALIVIGAAFVLYVSIGMGEIKDVSYLSTQIKAMNPKATQIVGVKLYTQPDAFTCGVTTVSVVTSYCQGKDVPPQALIDKYNLKGSMSADVFVSIVSKELPDYTVTYLDSLSDAELLERIHGQLLRGIPVPVFFGAENPYDKPNYDFHASVITGMDLDRQQVHILNVYGYEEDISLTEFLNRMSYRGNHYPFVQRAVVKLGLQKQNCIISLIKK